MVWTRTNPATGIAAKLLDDQVRDNNDALEAAIDKDHEFATGGGQTGEHDRVTLNDVAGDEAGLANHITIWNDAGVTKLRNGTSTIRKVSSDGDVIPAGTVMWFYADTAPTGWTILAASDVLLAVKGGSTYTTGGAQAGTWDQGNHTHAVGSIAAGSHTHTVPITGYGAFGSAPGPAVNIPTGRMVVGSGAVETTETLESLRQAAAIGGTSSTQPTMAGTSAGGGTANTWRPAARVGILATKDAY